MICPNQEWFCSAPPNSVVSLTSLHQLIAVSLYAQFDEEESYVSVLKGRRNECQWITIIYSNVT